MADRNRTHPRGRLAIGPGELMDIKDISYTEDNEGKIVTTMRGTSGTSRASSVKCTCSFNAVISSDGPERDWAEAVRKGTQKQIRIKIPGGETIAANGMFTSRAFTLPESEEATIALNFVGTVAA